MELLFSFGGRLQKTMLVDGSHSRCSYLFFKQGSSPHTLHKGLAEAGHPAQVTKPRLVSSARCFLCLKEDWEIRFVVF